MLLFGRMGGMVLSAVAASLADITEVASSADLAEVGCSADLAGYITVGVMSSAVAEAASLANIAEVASSADLSEVASSADFADVASSADIAGDVTIGVTSLADPAGVVTAGVAFQEECEVPSGSVCDYDDYFYDGHYNDKPDYFDYDDPGDFDSYPSLVCMALLGWIIISCIMICIGRMTVGVYCVSRGDVGVVPNWSGDEEGDMYEGDVAPPRAGSDEPVDGLGYSVISTFSPCGPC